MESGAAGSAPSTRRRSLKLSVFLPTNIRWQFSLSDIRLKDNIYYIAGGSIEQLQLLSAMLMSDFVRNQLLSITNCMNGGYPRWQSQYLRKLVMPDGKSIGEELSSRMLYAYRQSDVDGINAVMKDIVGQQKKAPRRVQSAGVQLSFGF